MHSLYLYEISSHILEYDLRWHLGFLQIDL